MVLAVLTGGFGGGKRERDRERCHGQWRQWMLGVRGGAVMELLSHAWGHAALLTPPQTMARDVSASRNLTHSFGQF